MQVNTTSIVYKFNKCEDSLHDKAVIEAERFRQMGFKRKFSKDFFYSFLYKFKLPLCLFVAGIIEPKLLFICRVSFFLVLIQNA